MKKISFQLTFIIPLFTLLFFPSETITGSKDGLLLWYNILLPSLLPFLILTNLLIASNSYLLLNKLFSIPIKFIFKTSNAGVFPVVIGFLCGFPLGAKTVSDLYLQGRLSENESYYLLSFCNNSSPMFIISVLVTQFYTDLTLLPYTISILMLSTYVTSLFTRRIYKFDRTIPPVQQSNNLYINMTIVDNCILDAIHLIVKIGAYIMIFSIIINTTSHIVPSNHFLSNYFFSTLELTNGLRLLTNSPSFITFYTSSMGLVSFGGFCSMIQTYSVISNSGLSIKPYYIQKIITAFTTVIISYLFIRYRFN